MLLLKSGELCQKSMKHGRCTSIRMARRTFHNMYTWAREKGWSVIKKGGYRRGRDKLAHRTG